MPQRGSTAVWKIIDFWLYVRSLATIGMPVFFIVPNVPRADSAFVETLMNGKFTPGL
jgi:hypothetical protein